MKGGEIMFKKRLEHSSALMLQGVELQASFCLTGGEQSETYKYVNSPSGARCTTPGGFDVKYVNIN